MRLAPEGFHYACACLLATACNSYDADLLDAPRKSNAQKADKRAQSDCAARNELCNGEDDDCDGIIDEIAALDCNLAHAVSRCTAGMCAVERCAEGYSNCNGTAADGCERLASDIACGECGRRCAQPALASDAATANANDAPKPASDSDLDAGNAPLATCDATAEVCDGRDNDCDGRVDEDASCACLTAQPSGQGEACDRCACEQCPVEASACLVNADNLWVSRCAALLQCYGRNSSDPGCAGGDCYQNGAGPCAPEVREAWLWTGISCATTRVTTPCGAATALRDTCMKTTCSSVCKF
jgi:hypothetical protein